MKDFGREIFQALTLPPFGTDSAEWDYSPEEEVKEENVVEPV
jgi:hypothetical protein